MLLMNNHIFYEWENDILYKSDSLSGKKKAYKKNSDKLEIEFEVFLKSINSDAYIYEENMNVFISETIFKIKNNNLLEANIS